MEVARDKHTGFLCWSDWQFVCIEMLMQGVSEKRINI
jgi:hypothetical protein